MECLVFHVCPARFQSCLGQFNNNLVHSFAPQLAAALTGCVSSLAKTHHHYYLAETNLSLSVP